MEEKENNVFEETSSVNSAEAFKDKNDKKRRAASEVLDWFDTVITSIVAIIVIFALITRLSTVDGGSMKPTLQDTERLLITDFAYTPERNDIVVVWTEGLFNERNNEWGKAIVKRVIGVPGDTISLDITAGAVYRNGEKLPQEIKGGILYEDGHPINDYTTVSWDMPGEITVPEGYVFVMGDNRNDSIDSRDSRVGLVNVNNIIGKAYLRVAPFDSFGGLY
ncbi:MAG: signal peptidase I [Ruminiclostridium sp.]|nr:signal peptidase I [Ruminiclostridium sp.]